jgi:hypothetical protein
MTTGPGAAGLLWLWAVVAELGPGDRPEPESSVPGTGSGPERGHGRRVADELLDGAHAAVP